MSDTLIVLVPLLVAPVVLLLAFAGCKSFGTAPQDETPAAPTPPPETTKPPPTDPDQPPPPVRPSYPDTIAVTPGLVGYWRLEETGGNLAADSGPNAPSGKLHGLYTGPAGSVLLGQSGALIARDPGDRAAGFDGAGGYVEVPYDARLNLEPALAFSVELWVKADPSANTGRRVLVSSREVNADASRGFELSLEHPANGARTVTGRVFADTATSEIKVEPGGAPDAWRHIVFTYDNGTLGLIVHVAGIPGTFTTSPVTGATYLAAQPPTVLRIAAGHGNQGQAVRFTAGVFDEVAIYAAALDLATAQAHVAAAS